MKRLPESRAEARFRKRRESPLLKQANFTGQIGGNLSV